MSTQIPLRIARSPMSRQCLFQRLPSAPPRLIAPSTRAFSSTPAPADKKKTRLVDVRMQLAGAENAVMNNPAPGVTRSSAARSELEEMAEDIGLMQNTIVRAPFSKLPAPTSWEFYAYFWTLLKAKFSGLYTRVLFTRCCVKKGFVSWVPVDSLKNRMLKAKAKRMYKRYYELLAAGDTKALSTLCLPPLASNLRTQIAARGPIKVTWTLRKFKSARIVSHRAAPLGADQPDTAYRQYIARIVSEQTLSTALIATKGEAHRAHAPKWTPASAETNASATPPVADEVRKSSQTQTVTEYIVLQTRVLEGKEEGWKIWGFTTETTPAMIEEDEAYWKKMLDMQTAA